MFAYEAGPIRLFVLCQTSGRLPDNSSIFMFWRLTRLTNKPALSFSLDRAAGAEGSALTDRREERPNEGTNKRATEQTERDGSKVSDDDDGGWNSGANEGAIASGGKSVYETKSGEMRRRRRVGDQASR